MSTRITPSNPFFAPQPLRALAIEGQDMAAHSRLPVEMMPKEYRHQISTALNITEMAENGQRNSQGKVPVRSRLATELNYLWLLSKPDRPHGEPVLRLGVEEHPSDPYRKLGHPALFRPGESKEAFVGGELYYENGAFRINKKSSRYRGPMSWLASEGVQPAFIDTVLLKAAKAAFHAQTDLEIDGTVEPASRSGSHTSTITDGQQWAPPQAHPESLKKNLNNARRKILNVIGGQRALDHSLRRAAQEGDVGAIARYLKRGANPNAYSSAGDAAIHRAVESLNPDALAEILHARARETHLANSGDRDAKVAQKMIAADPNLARVSDNKTALHLVSTEQVRYGRGEYDAEQVAMARMLLDRPDINEELLDKNGKTARDLVPEPRYYTAQEIRNPAELALLNGGIQPQKTMHEVLNHASDVAEVDVSAESIAQQVAGQVNRWFDTHPLERNELLDASPPLHDNAS